jgi:competence protein ComEC
VRRGRLWWRFALTVGVLVAFGTLTRWEPSVLRAEAMAAVAAAAAFAGRPLPSGRRLALAVAGCVLADPFLVRSVGFRLSVAACVGLAVLTPKLTRRGVPTLVAASLAAQLGAAVVLVPTFGTVPLVALPANVLAVPLAGPIMMWGLTAGPVAGALAPLAPLIHFPTRIALTWVAGVASRCASLPIAPLGGLSAALLAIATAAVVLTSAPRRRRVAVVGFLVAATTVGGLALRGPGQARDAALGRGARLWVIDGRSVVAVTGSVAPDVLEALRVRRVHRIDVLVVTRPGSGAAAGAWPLVVAFRPRLILAPEHHQVAGAHTARPGAEVAVGGVAIRVTAAGPPLRFSVTPTVYGQTRDPSSR